MKVTIKYLDNIQYFEDKVTITIGKNNCDVIISDFSSDDVIKLIYSSKYNNYVLVNSMNNSGYTYNNKPFSKVLVSGNFNISVKNLTDNIYIETECAKQQSHTPIQNRNVQTLSTTEQKQETAKDIFNNEIETNRIAIIKEIGYKITELKNSIRSLNIASLLLNASIFILSIISAFGMTNFLLGLKFDSSSSVLNLTTNIHGLIGFSVVILGIAFSLKYGVSTLLNSNQTKRYGESNLMPKFIIGTGSVLMFIVYILNLFYYKDVPGFMVASLFVSLLFVGALTIVSIASGYFSHQLREYNAQLANCEYREDFESVMKSYRGMINTYVNHLSNNKINNIKSNLLNNQLKMIVEAFIGIITAPFLAYGVSNTLAACFSEAAGWVRYSGIRFSPIFLVLATFLIIGAFFLFVTSFTIAEQIKGSEIIKFDGFHDYSSHGVTILGIDSMRKLTRTKNRLMFIACFIILIEFTMNISYFVTEIGGDLQGMFISFVAALVPTALLIAETNLLSATMYKINNYNKLLEMLD